MTISRGSFSYPAAFGLAALLIAPHLHAAAGMPHAPGPEMVIAPRAHEVAEMIWFAPLQALHVAARGGDVQEMAAFVADGQDIHLLSQDGRTVLHEAAHDGHADAIAYALAQEVSVDHRDNRGNTALSEAIMFGGFECIRQLVEDGHADVNLMVNFFGSERTPLDVACDEGDGEEGENVKNLLVVNGAHHSAEWLALHANDDN